MRLSTKTPSIMKKITGVVCVCWRLVLLSLRGIDCLEDFKCFDCLVCSVVSNNVLRMIEYLEEHWAPTISSEQLRRRLC